MIGIFLCLVAFAVTWRLANHSLGRGFASLMAVGYGYGFVRAKVADVGAHFLFDAALLGLYLSQFATPANEAVQARTATARNWTLLLCAWPFVCMAYSPFIPDTQPLVVQLVGLRTAVLMIPCLLLGARMRRQDMDTLAPAFALLNVVALVFSVLEYTYGIETFIPRSAVTDIVYLAQDVEGANGRFYRIPSTFLSAHAYGGTMVVSIPFVVHGLESERRVRILCGVGLGAAVVGAFLCGARTPVVILAAATLYVMISLRARASTLFALALVAAAVAYLVVNVERLQRFTTLGDTEMVQRRFNQSMSLSFFGVLTTYPVGAGLASAFGTSIPYFLASTDGVRDQIGLENEYARLLLEEGLVGLGLWLWFIAVSTFRRRRPAEASPSAAAYMLAFTVISWGTGLTGTGLLSSVPTTPMLFLMIGMRLVIARVQTKPALRQVGRARHGFGSAGAVPATAALTAHRTTR